MKKNYTLRLVLKDGTTRLDDVIAMTEEELETRARQLTDVMGEYNAVQLSTRTGSIVIVPTDSISYLEIIEAD